MGGIITRRDFNDCSREAFLGVCRTQVQPRATPGIWPIMGRKPRVDELEPEAADVYVEVADRRVGRMTAEHVTVDHGRRQFSDGAGGHVDTAEGFVGGRVRRSGVGAVGKSAAAATATSPAAAADLSTAVVIAFPR